MPGRLCFLVEDFWPVVHGATTQIVQVAERVSRQGPAALVLTRKIDRGHAARETLRGFDIRRVPPAVGLSRWGKYLMAPAVLAALVAERRRYDVLVVCDFKVLGACGVAAARLLGKRCYLRAESCGEMDGSYAGRFGAPPSRLQRALLRAAIGVRNRLLARADGFLSISTAITRELETAGVPRETILELTNGVDLSRFAPAEPAERERLRRQLGWSDGPQLLYTGRLARGKGLFELLAAWRRLAGELPEARLTLVGAGQGFSLACEDELRRRVEQDGLADRVRFTGNVDNVADYLRAADLFVFPSKSEGLGLSLVEAMACGLPCVASGVEGILDVIDDGVNGVLVPPADAGRLHRALRELLADPGRAARLGRAARRKVVERFDIDRIAERYLLLAGGGGAELSNR